MFFIKVKKNLEIFYEVMNLRSNIRPVDCYTLHQDPSSAMLHTTGNTDLDDYLGGGFPVGKPIHLCGPSGVGKSQLWYVLVSS